MSLVFGRRSLVFGHDPSVAESRKLTASWHPACILSGQGYGNLLLLPPTRTHHAHRPPGSSRGPASFIPRFVGPHPIRPPWPIRPAKAGRKPAIVVISNQLS